MNTISKFASAAAFLTVAGLATPSQPHAEKAHSIVTLKPMSGPGASSKNQPFLLDTLGPSRKSATSSTRTGYAGLP